MRLLIPLRGRREEVAILRGAGDIGDDDARQMAGFRERLAAPVEKAVEKTQSEFPDVKLSH